MKSSKDQVKLKQLYAAWNERKKAMKESWRLHMQIVKLNRKVKFLQDIEELPLKGTIKEFEVHEQKELRRIRSSKKQHAIFEKITKLNDDQDELEAYANIAFCKEVIRLFGNKVSVYLYPKDIKIGMRLVINGKWINLK